MDAVTKQAKFLYGVYGDKAGWKNYAGLPMPTWEELPPNIVECWKAVAIASLNQQI